MNQLSLVFEDKQLEELTKFAKCTAIEGVEISQEELEALQEAANVGLDGGQDLDIPQNNFNKIGDKPI